MNEEIEKTHANATTHIVGVFRAKKLADEETIHEVIRMFNWHWEIMSSALDKSIQYDMPAIVKKVQQLEKENEQLKKMLALGVNYERANG
jgi:ABC-type methionine transport system ATPase subunit